MAIEIGMSIESLEKPRVESSGGAYKTTNHDEHHAHANRDPEHPKKLETEQVRWPAEVIGAARPVEQETDSATRDRPHENAADASEHRAHAKRNSAPHRRAVSTRAVDHAGPADLLCAGFHIPPAHSRRDFIRDEARAVIGDPQLELTGVNAEVDHDPFRASVSADVVEPLLRETVQRFVRTWHQRGARWQVPDR